MNWAIYYDNEFVAIITYSSLQECWNNVILELLKYCSDVDYNKIEIRFAGLD